MSQIKGFLGSTVGLITCLVAAALGIYLLVFHWRMLCSSCLTSP